MNCLCLTQLLSVTVLCFAAASAVADPPEEIPPPRPAPAEEMPPPRPLPPPNLLARPHYQPPVLPQYGSRSVWQFYAVDSRGRFRPLVVQTPYGSFYRYDLSPYPWTSNRTYRRIPFVVD
jgi:hypothetical protein